SLTLSHLPNVISFCNTCCALEPPFLENVHGNDERASSEEERNTRLAPLINGFQFPNLKHIAIMGCNKMRCLFSPSTSKSLVHLMDLEICSCGDIEEIVSLEEDTTKTVFHNLQHLKLENLPKLKAFCKGSHDFEFPLLHEVFLKNCHVMEIFSCGSSYTPKLDKVTMEIGNVSKNIWMGDLNATMPLCKGMVSQQTLERSRFIEQDHHHLLYYLRSETELFVEDSEKLLHCVPLNMFHRFQHIKQLKVRECGSIVEIFESKGLNADGDEGCYTKTLYNYNMQELHLYDLPKLMHIWRESHGGILSFRNLRKLKIGCCDGLKSVLSPSIARGLRQLQEFSVHECEELEKIISDEEEKIYAESINNVKIIAFPSLKWLTLYRLRRLECFCSSAYHFELPSCHDIIIKECPKIEACCKGMTKTSQN
ncbi:hypothetical protein PIB30_024971, partial [Stylosanthes scabra]|nr:hypothetical protein [Stylosanthes scabra]